MPQAHRRGREVVGDQPGAYCPGGLIGRGRGVKGLSRRHRRPWIRSNRRSGPFRLYILQARW
jgi:hypothetical protein